MNDAYTIGITLSLDDEVSSGIAAIRGDLESLNQALGKSLSELADLRSAAGPALSSLWRASAAIRPAQTAKTPAVASGDTSSWPQAAPMPANPEAAPEWRAAERPAPVLPAHPFAPPPAEAPAYSEEQRNSRIEVLPFASDAIPPRVPDRAGAPIAPAPARATPAPAAPSAPDGLSLDDLLGFTHSMIARAPFAESPASVEDAAPEGGRTIVIGAAAAPLDTGPQPPPAPRTRPTPQSFRAPAFRAPGAMAPLSPLFAAGPPAAPSGPSASASGANSAIRGDVFLDGARVGHWLGEHMATSAARPPSGYSGVDPRLGPLWPGAPVVP